ncbi:hypothetical protein BDP27DRAFT_1457222, partial [Rhodocollybia butyracea]
MSPPTATITPQTLSTHSNSGASSDSTISLPSSLSTPTTSPLPVSAAEKSHLNPAILGGTIGAVVGALLLLLALLLWIRHRRRLARLASFPADFRSIDKEESIFPFIAETQVDITVPQRNRGIGIARPTINGAPFSREVKLKRSGVRAQSQNAQEELRITRQALELLRD